MFPLVSLYLLVHADDFIDVFSKKTKILFSGDTQNMKFITSYLKTRVGDKKRYPKLKRMYFLFNRILVG